MENSIFPKGQTFKESINSIVFGRDTRLGVLFDQVLIFALSLIHI